MLDLEEIQSFVAVATHGGFRRAADALNRTQSTVSHHVARLEQRAGRTLFSRTTRSVRLTDDGEQLLEQARQLLNAEVALREQMTGGRLQGHIRMGASEEVASTRLPPILAKFAQNNPRVSLEVRVGTSAELITACKHGSLDLALVKRPPGSSIGESLWAESLFWVAAEHYRVNANASLPVALYQQEESISRGAALAALRSVQRRFHIAYTSFSLVGIRAAVMAGLAVAALPESALGSGLRVLDRPERLPPLDELTYVAVRRTRRANDRAVDSLHRSLLDLRR